MSNRNRVELPPQLSLARCRKVLTVASILAACALLAAPAARAAVTDSGSAMGSGIALQSPPAADLAVAALQPHVPEVAGQRPGAAAETATLMEASPANASTGFFLGGTVTANWSGSGIRMTAGSVQNQSGSTSGTLRLQLWATTTAPVFGSTISFFALGPAFTLGTLQNNFQFTNVDTGLLTPYTPPPNGCYFVTVALEEFNGSQYVYVDLATLTSGGVADPGGSGFDLFGFGVPNGSCSGSSGSCNRTATTACLVSGRFQVRVSYVNPQSSGNGTVMSFSGTRAESDESVFLYFTDPSNFEMGLKILPACGINNHFWVFIGGLTNQGWTVNILDTSNGATRTYTNALNHLTSTTADTGALNCP
jgi:hypothetical protein